MLKKLFYKRVEQQILFELDGITVQTLKLKGIDISSYQTSMKSIKCVFFCLFVWNTSHQSTDLKVTIIDSSLGHKGYNTMDSF